ncbi:hypothetical protein SAMN05421827_111176 [Pedobacter terrae]|uniref:Uncharacterized protein n=1 Tax=Pedobacter terrae TaxID=405671 RepID=A0A1G7XE81_9SPHI|nr:hypothetical protein [Pedobacter terrae]SDG82437.1 hypothetical protein SAMN05421827_111176 [Pedobacter terrae]
MKLFFFSIMINCFTFFKQEEPLSKVANINLTQKSVRLSKNELAAISKRSGAASKYYFVLSAHLYNYVKQIFSATDKVELNAADGAPQGTLFRGKLKNIKGLYIMQPNYPSKFGAMGHATLWTGSMLLVVTIILMQTVERQKLQFGSYHEKNIFDNAIYVHFTLHGRL